MAEKVGGFLKQLFDKGKAQISLHMRRSVVEKARAELNRIAHQHYSSLYLGSILQASMTDVIQNLQSYIQESMYGWRQVSSNLAADGSAASFRYALDFTESFQLGGDCLMTPLTVAARVKVNILSNHNQTESVTVPYRLLFTINVRQGRGGVAVDASLQEIIDPQNAVNYLRNGLFEAPSMVHIRAEGISSQSLLQYLHQRCRENRPGFQEWFDQGGRNLADVADALRKLQQAQRDLDAANGKVAQLR